MKVRDLIQLLNTNNQAVNIFGKSSRAKSYTKIYGFESFLNGEVAGTEHSVLIILNKRKSNMRVEGMIQLLSEKNPDADIFITEYDSNAYYEILNIEATEDEGSVMIVFDKRKKMDKKNLMNFKSMDNKWIETDLATAINKLSQGCRVKSIIDEKRYPLCPYNRKYIYDPKQDYVITRGHIMSATWFYEAEA